MEPMIQSLLKNGPVVTDGAWGTELQARGLATGESSDAWNLSHPDLVGEVASAYVEAGSQVILTNTFQANRFALEERGLADSLVAINQTGVEISRKAAEGRAKVFASLGPSGRLMMMGQASKEELEAAFSEQALYLARAGADALVIETMSDLEEAKLAVKACYMTGLPVVASMVFDSGAKKDRTMMGATPEQAAETLLMAGASIIGANCGQGIAGYVEICRRLSKASGRPVWIKANAGLPELVDGKVTYMTSAEEFGSFVPQLLEAGAGFIGGCCGTGPAYIRAVRKALKV